MDSSVSPPHLLTIGHSNRTITELIEHLTFHNISVLVDVRSSPYSARFPDFCEKALRASMSETRRIQYIWMKELGGREEQFGNLEERLRTNAEVIEKVAALLALANDEGAKGLKVAFMCSEGDWCECHRQFIATHLVDTGLASVSHIRRDGKLEPHPAQHHGVIAKHEQAKKALQQQATVEGIVASPPPAASHAEDAVPLSAAKVTKNAKTKKKRLQ